MTDLLTSKKFLASVLASILALTGLMNGLTVGEIAVIVGPLTAYVIGQGIADNGKEAVKETVRLSKDV